MSLLSLVTEKRQELADDFSDYASDVVLTEEERAALREADELADYFADIKPAPFSVSDMHLFRQPEPASNEPIGTI